MRVTEQPTLFSCGQDELLGFIHHPEQSTGRGVLAIVAGGPQYRSGCCRQLTIMARTLASQGTPVMRFDQRGMGDSQGEVRGFEHIQQDIQDAIEHFLAQSPGLKEIVLWGGCDAAAAAMIHGPRHPVVTGMILSNPWVHSEETHAKVVLKHYYLQRLRDKSFWLKLLKLRINPVAKLRAITSALNRSRQSGADTVSAGTPDADLPFVPRMLKGMQAFDGRILLFMSGLSLVSKEFDELVASSKAWQEALARLSVTRLDIPDADQTFSSTEHQHQVIDAAGRWLAEW